MARHNVADATAQRALGILRERDHEAYLTLVRQAAGAAGGDERAAQQGTVAEPTEKMYNPIEHMGLAKDDLVVRYMERSQAAGEFCGIWTAPNLQACPPWMGAERVMVGRLGDLLGWMDMEMLKTIPKFRRKE